MSCGYLFKIISDLVELTSRSQFLKMVEPTGEGLSAVTVVIFIACGVLTFILMFLFAKRQITRFALKSRRGPHIPVGYDAPKALKRDLERRLDRIREIKYEPLLQQEENDSFNSSEINNTKEGLPIHHYRMKAVDAVTSFLKELNPPYHRRPGENLQSFLITTLGTTNSKLINNICDLYEHARHDPQEFNDDECKLMNELLSSLWQCLNTLSPVKTVKSINTKADNSEGSEPRVDIADIQTIKLVQRNVNSSCSHENSTETMV